MTGASTGLILLLAAMAVESFAQLFLQIGAAGGPAVLRPASRRWAERLVPGSSGRPWVVLGLVAYVLEILLYTLVLHFLDVSVAFPVGSLCFVGVAVLSRLFLGEAVSRTRWLGVGLILAGSFWVAL
jgi:drug/metabolite transporter (DMT)-like permease